AQKQFTIATSNIDPTKSLSQPFNKAKTKQYAHISRIDLVKATLKNDQLNLLPYLDKEFDLEAYAFAQGVAGIASRRENATNASPREAAKHVTVDQFTWVDRLAATNPATAIGDALREIVNRKRGQPLAGMVLLTDGANNSGSQPREVAAMLRQENLPLYIYGVGITSPRDIIVANLFAPDVTFVKDEVSVTVRVRAQGLSGENAEVNLKLGDQTVATKAINF